MRVRFIYPSLASLALLATLTACGIFGKEAKVDTPSSTSQQELYRSRGSLTGEGGLLSIGGSKDKDNGGGGIGVNSYLWRATLDTLGFMPFTSADPFGGVVITDWYEDPKAKGERYKVNALILDRSLRADGVKITLFKQRRDEKGNWRDMEVPPSLARDLEDTILTRARELRMAATK